MMGMIEENLRLPMMPLLPVHRAPLQNSPKNWVAAIGCCSAIGTQRKMKTMNLADEIERLLSLPAEQAGRERAWHSHEFGKA
jgi:hypothetical protein